MIIYLIWYKPFESNKITRSEVMNEVTVLLLLYFMLAFTDWRPSGEERYFYGWFYIAFSSLNLLIHIVFLIREIYFSLKRRRIAYKIAKNSKAKKAPVMKDKTKPPQLTLLTAKLESVEESDNENEEVKIAGIDIEHDRINYR